MGEYVVRAPVKWGAPDGSVVVLQPGDSLPAGVSEETKLQLLAAGTVVPADTHKMVEEQDEKRRKLDEQRLKLDEDQARLQTEDIVLQQQAEQKLAEVQTDAAGRSVDRGDVQSRPTNDSEQREKDAQEKTKQAEQSAKESASKGTDPSKRSDASTAANIVNKK